MIDFKLLQGKLAELKNDTTVKVDSSLYWKPSGTHKVRILPYILRPKNPFLEIYYHYNIDKRPHVSPSSYGEADPIVEFATKLQNMGNKEDWVAGKKLEPKRRVHVPIIVRDEEDQGVRFWGFSDTIYKELVEIMLDPDYGDITDLKTGRDISVIFSAPSGEDKYAKTSIRVRPVPSVVTEDKGLLKAIEEMPNVETVCKATSYDDLKEILLTYLKLKESKKSDTVTEVDADDDEEAEDSPKPVAESRPIPTTAKSAVDAFSQLFDEK